MTATHRPETSHTGQARGALIAALAITAGILLLEVVGGLLTNSLALLADAGHVLTDVAALGLSLCALWIAARPSSPRRTYGFQRVEILAALVNGLMLLAISGWVVWEASQRLGQPPEVRGGGLLLFAALGLSGNLASAYILSRGPGDNLNLRSAWLHVMGDLLGSVGAVVAGLVVWLTGWTLADPLVSLLITALILLSAGRLLRETVNVLLEGTPQHIDVSEVERAMRAVPGVQAVHDLHVWTVTSGFVALSGHALIAPSADSQAVLRALQRMLHDRFAIEHTTVQVEHSERDPLDCQPC